MLSLQVLCIFKNEISTVKNHVGSYIRGFSKGPSKSAQHSILYQNVLWWFDSLENVTNFFFITLLIREHGRYLQC